MATNRFVYDFDEPSDGGRELLGGKGIGLAEMTQLGMPVPAGFTITTDACRAYMAVGGQVPEGLDAKVDQHLAALQEKTGKRFGDSADPLLVSVRSGAAVSMPGMMDTILNLGLNDEAVRGLAERTGNARFANDSYQHLIQMYGEVVDDIDGASLRGRAGEAQGQPRRDARRRPLGGGPRGARRDVQADLRDRGRRRPSRRTRARSSSEPCARSSSPGRSPCAGSTGALTTSPTTSAPPSTSCRWSSATRAPVGNGRGVHARPVDGRARPVRRVPGRTHRARTSSPASARPSRWRRCRRRSPRRSTQLMDTMRRLEEHYRDMQDIEFTVEDGASTCSRREARSGPPRPR